MNYMQLGLFGFFVTSVFLSGVGFYALLDKGKKSFINRFVFLGEVLLIGGIWVVGQFLLLSLLGLYSSLYLVAAIATNYLFLLNKDAREAICDLFRKKASFDLPLVIFAGLTAFFIIRNCYFMVAVDSISTYLYTQKLWLANGSSLVGSIGHDLRVFNPHFDIVPSALGLSIFGDELLFPQMVNFFWRFIVILLVFGYTSFRLNRYCGLAAVMLVLFDTHFFYSGMNQWVLINGALIAFLFAIAYNFWEARAQGSTFRLFLALFFLMQLMGNKYQMVYVLFFMLILGLAVQKELLKNLKEVVSSKKLLIALFGSIIITSFWYIKNFIVTGIPVFPAFAAELGIFDWTPQLADTVHKLFGGVSFSKFIKYMSYLFIWPGVNASKYVILIVSFFPIIIMRLVSKSQVKKDLIVEICFWLSMSILLIMGITLICHQDPRYYRFPIAILSYTAIFSIFCILKHFFNIKWGMVLSLAVILSAVPGYKVIYQAGGHFRLPNLKENVSVLSNKINTDYSIKKHYPQIENVLKALHENQDKIKESAWGVGEGMSFPAFLLPVRPVVSFWYTTIIKWDSYGGEEAIINDLKQYGIKWIMSIQGDKLIFMPIADYAKEALKFNRRPTKIYFDYGFPPELSLISY